jgi:opacity protein-like surface antigen
MKKLLYTLVCLVLFSASAYAGDIYVGADLGSGIFTQKDLNSPDELETDTNNLFFGLVAGWRHDTSESVRVRLEAQLAHTLGADGEYAGRGVMCTYSNYMYMTNMYIDIDVTSSVVVYPMVGLGFVWSKLSTENRLLDETAFNGSFQLGIGAQYMVERNVSVDFNVRYIWVGEAIYDYDSAGAGYTANLETSGVNANVGIKYWF